MLFSTEKYKKFILKIDISNISQDSIGIGKGVEEWNFKE